MATSWPLATSPMSVWALLDREELDAAVEDWTADSTPPRLLRLSEVRIAADALSRRIAYTPTAAGAGSAGDGDGATPPCGAVVAILVEAGAELIVGMLAVVRACRPFLLLDPVLPTERLQYQLDDTGSGVLLVPDSGGHHHPQWVARVAALEAGPAYVRFGLHELLQEAARNAAAADSGPSAAATTESALAYVCYTSGSTGRPKGVAVSPAALCSYARANALAHGVGTRARVLLASAVSFDPCIGEAFTALAAPGASLCLPSRSAVKERLSATLRQTGATHVCSTPALWGDHRGAAGRAARAGVRRAGRRGDAAGAHSSVGGVAPALQHLRRDRVHRLPDLAPHRLTGGRGDRNHQR